MLKIIVLIFILTTNLVGGTTTFDPQLKTQVAKEGSNYKLKCRVLIQPSLTFWTVDGVVPDGVKFQVLPSDSNLLVRNVTQRDYSREYLCHALVPGREVVEALQITLNEDQASSQQQEVFGSLGSKVTLSCSVARARPPPKFVWLRGNGTFIHLGNVSTGPSSSNLTLLLESEDVYGTYICEAWNSVGKSEQVFSLRPKPSVVRPPFLYPKTIEGKRILLGLKFEKGQDVVNNLSYLVQYQRLGGDAWNEASSSGDEVLLQNLSPNSTYAFRTAARSPFGDLLGNFSNILLVTTDKEVEDVPNDVIGQGRGLQFEKSLKNEETSSELLGSRVVTTRITKWRKKPSSSGNNKVTVVVTNTSTIEETEGDV